MAADEDARIRANTGSGREQERLMDKKKRRRVDISSSSESDASTQERCAGPGPMLSPRYLDIEPCW